MSIAKTGSLAKNAYQLTGSEALRYIRAGELTVVQLAWSLLRHISKRDKYVRAWAYLDEEYVLNQAFALDAVPMEKRGQLHGLPIAVKDVIHTKDMPTQFNSKAYEGNFPTVDAAVIQILRAEGALILGKTTTTEFAATGDGPATRNPHDLSRTPGGSSFGSGASVGDFQAPVALGTQTGGSVIRPACFNGTYGFKPTGGCISREGLKFFSLTFDTIGFFTRCVEDLVLLASVFNLLTDPSPHTAASPRLAASLPFTPPSSVKGVRIGVLRTMMWPQAGPGTRKALDHAVSLLRLDGAKVEVIKLPPEFTPLPEWYDIVLAWEGGVSFLSELRANPKHLSKPLADLAETRGEYSQLDYRKAVDGIMALRPCMDRFLGNFHAVLTPSAPDEAPQGSATGSYAFCKIWSALQGPVVHVPGFCGESRMPIGLSLVAPRDMDAQLLAVAAPVGALFEAKGGWTRSVHQEQSEKLVGEGNGHKEALNGLWMKSKL